MASNPNLSDTDYELLSAYIDDALSVSERSVLEARLNDDPALQYELNALRQTVALINQLPRMTAPRDFSLTREMVGIRLVDKPRRPLIFPILQAVSAIAAMVMIVFAVGLFLNTGNNLENSANDSNSVALQVEQSGTDESEVAFANTGELSTEERLTAVANGTQSAQEARGMTANATQRIPQPSTLLTLTSMAQEIVESESEEATAGMSQFTFTTPDMLLDSTDVQGYTADTNTNAEADFDASLADDSGDMIPATGGAGAVENAQQAEAMIMTDMDQTSITTDSAVMMPQATPSPMRTSLPTMQTGMDNTAPSAPAEPMIASLPTATRRVEADGTTQDSADESQVMAEESMDDEIGQARNELTVTVETTEESPQPEATPTPIALNETDLGDGDDDNTPLAIGLLIGGIILLAGVFASRWVIPRHNN